MKNEDLQKAVYGFSTEHEKGFTDREIDIFLKSFPDCNIEKFNKAMDGNTCMVINNEIINCRCDVLTALRCGLENRDMNFYEFD